MNMVVQPLTPEEFIKRWQATGAAERANYQLFLTDLCDILDVPRPEPSKPNSADDEYVFEHPVVDDDGRGNRTTKFIDLYKKRHFVLEAKQGSDKDSADEALIKPKGKSRKGTAVRGTKGWSDAMLSAFYQADYYARLVSDWPPFIIVVDVGHSIEVFSEFTCSGKTYVPYPDPRSYRIQLSQLANPEIRERLKIIWTDPLSLDPSKRSAKVTREVAAQLANLARSFERSGHSSEKVSQFLMRCLFTMFAEDVGLLPEKGFSNLLKSRRGKLETFVPMVSSLWAAMDRGEFSPFLETKLLRFNGDFFAESEALPVTDEQLELLITASDHDWSAVEPAIFGTLLERALDPVERHKLGAHYTPRSYVERLVIPTVIDPLRSEWKAVQTASVTLAKAGKIDDARAEAQRFLQRLCSVIVLDPACGSGNFLYITLEHLKCLEGEIYAFLDSLGYRQQSFEGVGFTVDPHQLLGIEISSRAAAITEMVLWIGYLQWHFRTFGNVNPHEPVIRAFHNIECRDAVLAYDASREARDSEGELITRWDGRTMKSHPVTGEFVPDDTARIPAYEYINPRAATWPKAEFVVGNPPFIGNKRMRAALGDGYVDALRAAWPTVPETVDFVMYWWHRAAELTNQGKVKGFGFITTNSLTQGFNRRVVDDAFDDGLSISMAIPNHPWVDNLDGADVRVAMTVGTKGRTSGILRECVKEVLNADGSAEVRFHEQAGKINSDLSVGADVTRVTALSANEGLSFMGVTLIGQGFVLDPSDPLVDGSPIVKPYLIGRDLNQKPTRRFVIDFFGLDEAQARAAGPAHYQRVVNRVKPERDQNNREGYRNKWWLFGEQRSGLRRAAVGLERFIVTCRTSTHRVFTFVPANTVVESTIIAIMIDEPFVLGVLSSRAHVDWSLKAGTRLGVGDDPRYNNSICFDRFPFPSTSDELRGKISNLASELENHRKHQQALHPHLTLTSIYNVLEKVRAGETLTSQDRKIHDDALISTLHAIHETLDRAVFEAYGWPFELTADEVIERLVQLNVLRVKEEAVGIIHWLRPEFQNPRGRVKQEQVTLIESEKPTKAQPAKPIARTLWPKTLAEQAQAVRSALTAAGRAVSAEEIARTFSRAKVDRVEELLETLASLGEARGLSDGAYVSTKISLSIRESVTLGDRYTATATRAQA